MAAGSGDRVSATHVLSAGGTHCESTDDSLPNALDRRVQVVKADLLRLDLGIRDRRINVVLVRQQEGVDVRNVEVRGPLRGEGRRWSAAQSNHHKCRSPRTCICGRVSHRITIVLHS